MSKYRRIVFVLQSGPLQKFHLELRQRFPIIKPMERPSCELVATPEEVRNYLLTYPATVAIHGDFGVFANESQGAGRALNSVVFSYTNQIIAVHGVIFSIG